MRARVTRTGYNVNLGALHSRWEERASLGYVTAKPTRGNLDGVIGTQSRPQGLGPSARPVLSGRGRAFCCLGAEWLVFKIECHDGVAPALPDFAAVLAAVVEDEAEAGVEVVVRCLLFVEVAWAEFLAVDVVSVIWLDCTHLVLFELDRVLI